MNLSKLRERTRALELTVEEEVLHFSYRPALVTGALIDDFLASVVSRDPRQNKNAAEIITKIVSDWDMTLSGKKVKLDPEVILAEVPDTILSEIIEKISGDRFPNPTP